MRKQHSIEKIILITMMIISALILIILTSCEEGHVAIINNDGQDSEIITETEYVCDSDTAFNTLWCYCKEICEERANSKCHSKPCVRWVKLKMDDSIECKCKVCNTEEEANECNDNEVEEEEIYLENNIERPYKPLYLEEEIDGVY